VSQRPNRQDDRLQAAELQPPLQGQGRLVVQPPCQANHKSVRASEQLALRGSKRQLSPDPGGVVVELDPADALAC